MIPLAPGDPGRVELALQLLELLLRHADCPCAGRGRPARGERTRSCRGTPSPDALRCGRCARRRSARRRQRSRRGPPTPRRHGRCVAWSGRCPACSSSSIRMRAASPTPRRRPWPPRSAPASKWREPSGRGHAVELVRDADAGAVVVFGGDGAFNEALNGLRAGLPLGLVPGGGSSVLPRALGLPADVEGAARRIADAIRIGRTSEVSLGRVNGRRFGFAAALGFPAEVVRRVDELGREDGRRPPDRAFLTTAARLLAERRGRLPPEVEVDGHGRASFALVANGDPYTYLGRLPVRPTPRRGGRRAWTSSRPARSARSRSRASSPPR